MNTYIPEQDDRWESGELGCSEEHVAVASAEEMKEVDDALGLQLVSIRLQRQLISNLKAIAEFHGINYQPMIRDLLNRFAASEMRTILEKQLAEMTRIEESAADTGPVTEFLERERKRA